MTSYVLVRLRNFRARNGGVPAILELNAIIETIMHGWDCDKVEATAQNGVGDSDQQAIRALIEAEGLSVTPERAIRELLEECKAIVAAHGAQEG